MKKIISMLSIILFLAACSGNSESKQEEVVTAEQEAEIVGAITDELDEAQQELKKQTEESLQEVDSLLENF